MKNTLFLPLLIVYASTTEAQVNSSANHLYLTINPTQIFDPWDGLFAGASAEYGANDGLAVYTDVGFYLPNQPKWVLRTETKGYKVKAGVKLIEWDAEGSNYWACEGILKQEAFAYHDSIKLANIPVYDRKYHINGFVACLNVKYGWAMVYWRHIVVDAFAGAGVRYKYATNDLPPDEQKGILTGEHHGDLIGFGERATGSHFYPNITFGIKVGYCIFNKKNSHHISDFDNRPDLHTGEVPVN